MLSKSHQTLKTELMEYYKQPGFLQSNNPTIDAWSISPDNHVFGYWSHAIDAYYVRKQPEKSVKIPIIGRNYPGNPTTKKLHEWLYRCIQDPEIFTLEGYLEYMKEGMN